MTKVQIAICRNCGYEWVPRNYPRRCPLCSSTRVDREEVELDE